MIRLLIIADDFTGALDSGVHLASRGARTLVVTDAAARLAELDPAVEVLVMDAETRHLCPEQAGKVVAHIVEQAARLGVPYIYKKTDSALRGNIGAELSATLQAAGGEQLFFFPALPEMNRCTVDGVHYIAGTPVAQSVFGTDPFEPVTRSRVSELIAQQSDVPTTSLPPLDADSPLPRQQGIVVMDASTEEQLLCAGRRLMEAGKLRLMAGCAGFAAVLPEILGLGGDARPEVPKLDKRLLVLCGSVNPITVRQLGVAEAAGFLHLHMTPRQQLEAGYWDTEEGKAQLARWTRMLAEAGNGILDSNGPDGNEPTRRYAEENGLEMEEVRTRIAASLGRVLAQLHADGVEGTLLITGGDTLLQCMRRIGVSELHPICELASGVVLSRFTLDGAQRYVISKSGGFGPPDLLVQLAQQLQNQNESA